MSVNAAGICLVLVEGTGILYERLEHIERVEHCLGVVLTEDILGELAVFLYPALQVDAGRFHVQFFDGA